MGDGARNGTALAPALQSPSPEAARQEIARARTALTHSARALKSEIEGYDVPTRVKASIAKHPLLWVTGAFAVGAMLGKLSRRLM